MQFGLMGYSSSELQALQIPAHVAIMQKEEYPNISQLAALLGGGRDTHNAKASSGWGLWCLLHQSYPSGLIRFDSGWF